MTLSAMRDLKQDFLDHSRLSSRDLYGKRQGRKLKPRQAALVAEMLPQLALPIALDQRTDPRQWFGGMGAPGADPWKPQEVWLEIGFGGGEHLFAWAQAQPQTGFLGVEYYINGVAKLLSQLDLAARAGEAPANIRLHHGDGRDLLDSLSDSSIDRLFVLQPDPWPKRRHHTRRIIQRSNLEAFARVLRPGGLLRISTDHSDYLTWILREMQAARDLFRWTARQANDWQSRPADWPDSRYAAKAREAGRPVTYLAYQRNT